MTTSTTRRQLLAAGCVALCSGAFAQPQRRAKLVLAGPFAAVSNPLIRIAESGALNDVADKVEFVTWKDPDQLRVLALDGAADFIATPTNVAANLFNRGVKLKLINVATWGSLWMVSRSPSLKTLADFKGQELLMPFRGDMPDIVFQLLASKQGLDPQRDLKLRYVASPLEAMQLLIMRRADHALLAEPAVSTALRKTHSFPVSAVAPELYRSVDLQQEWGRVFQRAPRIPQAGICALGKTLDDAPLLARFQKAYADAHAWCHAEPDACGRMAAQRIEMLTPEGAADAIRAATQHLATGAAARPELEFFFEQLRARDPGLVGGKLPAAEFYFNG
ncbi:MAG: PhnD/SsuA/transferrin family substrate-binding protein [Rubrivivax sp.]